MSPANADTPAVTVLMPVFNGGEYLRPAIDSILGQTFADFEFLIIDDGSTDASLDVCRSYADPRIRVYENGENIGLIATLNRGFKLAKGRYIARMDCDDYSFPDRLRKQLDFMESHPEVGVCGTWFEREGEAGGDVMRPAVEDAAIRFFLIFDAVFAHSSVILRRDLVEMHGMRFRSEYQYAEDYDFWVRCGGVMKLANIPEVLLRYNFHPRNTSSMFRGEQLATADRIRGEYLARLGLHPSETELRAHLDLIRFQFRDSLEALGAAGRWLKSLGDAAKMVFGLSEQLIYRELGRYWYGAAAPLAGIGLPVWRIFMDSPIGRATAMEYRLKLLWRCILKRGVGALPD